MTVVVRSVEYSQCVPLHVQRFVYLPFGLYNFTSLLRHNGAMLIRRLSRIDKPKAVSTI